MLKHLVHHTTTPTTTATALSQSLFKLLALDGLGGQDGVVYELLLEVFVFLEVDLQKKA